MTKADSIYKHPEVPAHYEGGIHKLGAYISDKMMENAEIYPCEHIHIVAMFTVEKNGEITNVRIHENFSSVSNHTLNKILYGMPKWKCAIDKGHEVRSYSSINLRFRFDLSNEVFEKKKRMRDSLQNSRPIEAHRETSIRKGVTSIGKHAFWGCDYLRNISIPQSVTSVDDGAFEDCTCLKKVILPKSVATIGINAFSGCKQLSRIDIPKGIVDIPDGMLFACSNLTKVVIPEGVENIGCDAFCKCSGLKSVTLPFSLERIDESAFRGCPKLERIIIPKGSRQKIENILDIKFHHLLVEQ